MKNWIVLFPHDSKANVAILLEPKLCMILLLGGGGFISVIWVLKFYLVELKENCSGNLVHQQPSVRIQ